MAYSQSREFRSRAIATVFFILDDEEDPFYGETSRVHDFWMRPHLEARYDMSQRNTLAKLERDFVRVSTSWYKKIGGKFKSCQYLG